MVSLEIADGGVIYRNPDPGHMHVSALFPHPIQLTSEEWLCLYNRGSALYAADLVFAQARSRDGGKTWHQEGLIYDRAQDDRPFSYHDPFVSRMSAGNLVLGAFRADRSDPTRPMFSETGGLQKTETILFHSDDGGRSWQGPQPVRLPAGLVATPASPIVELASGRWFWPFDQWKDFDDPGPYQPRTLGFFSDDQGATWGGMIAYADAQEEGKGYWHGKPIRLDDGRLLTLFWSANLVTGENLSNHLAWADSSARHWTKPAATGIPGQTNWLATLGGSQLVAVYTLREAEQPGIMAVLSEDEGLSWDIGRQVRLWDATGRARLGVDTLDAYPRSHDTIAFGAPTALPTSAGDVYASWWCMEAGIVHMRWARLRLVEQG